MNFRLARPSALVDLNHVDGLVGIDNSDDMLLVGAMTRQWDLEHSPAAASHCPMLPAALRWVGHTATRSRGTIGGSIAHADPAAELPTVAVALGAEMTVASRDGQTRSVEAGEFFVDHYTTVVESGQLLTDVRFPHTPPSMAWGFEEFSFRSGDFAIASAAVTMDIQNGSIELAGVTLGGVGSTPVRARQAEQVLAGEEPSEQAWRTAGEAAAMEIDPIDDEVPAGYRRQIVATLVENAARDAWDARGETA